MNGVGIECIDDLVRDAIHPSQIVYEQHEEDGDPAKYIDCVNAFTPRKGKIGYRVLPANVLRAE